MRVFAVVRLGRRVWHCPRREAAATGLAAIGGGLDGSVDTFADGVAGRSIDPPSNGAIGAAILDRLHAPPASRAKPRNASAFRNFTSHVDTLLRDFGRWAIA